MIVCCKPGGKRLESSSTVARIICAVDRAFEPGR